MSFLLPLKFVFDPLKKHHGSEPVTASLPPRLRLAVGQRIVHGLIVLGLMASGLMVSFPVWSATPVKTTLVPSSTVSNACVIQSSDSLSFGVYNPTGGMSGVASGQIVLTCTKKATAAVSPISGGSVLTGPGGTLNYALYVDSGFSKQWGKPVITTQTVNVSSKLYFNSRNDAAKTPAACAAAAGGTFFAFNTVQSKCFLGYSTTATSWGFPGPPYQNGLVIGSTVYKTQDNVGVTYYLPFPGTLALGGTSYSTTTFIGNAQTLSAVSMGAQTPILLPYYAKLPGGQDVVPGAYSDQVIFQVQF